MNFLSNDLWGPKLRSGLGIAFVVMVLQIGVSTSCTDPYIPPTTRTELAFAISSAIELLRTTREGAPAGFQIKGSATVLIDSITVAQKVVARPDSIPDQFRVDRTTANLKTAMEIYKTKKVVEVDPVNLVGQYTFDELTSLDVGAFVKDYSGKNHNGALGTGSPDWGRGTPTYGTDRYGSISKALYFNYGAHVEIPYQTDLNPSRISISLWAKATGYNALNRQYGISLNRANGYQLVFDGTGPKANFTVNPAENPGAFITDNGENYTKGVWKHFVVTFGDGFMRFYSNGVLEKEVARAGTAISLPAAVNLTIGQDLPTILYSSNPASPNYIGNGGYFIGYLDEIRIYKSILTASQVTSIYTLEKP
ncbi:hypothetical protein BH09BAC3_BH09BAC3_26380 [soil metagenome]